MRYESPKEALPGSSVHRVSLRAPRSPGLQNARWCACRNGCARWLQTMAKCGFGRPEPGTVTIGEINSLLDRLVAAATEEAKAKVLGEILHATTREVWPAGAREHAHQPTRAPACMRLLACLRALPGKALGEMLRATAREVWPAGTWEQVHQQVHNACLHVVAFLPSSVLSTQAAPRARQRAWTIPTRLRAAACPAPQSGMHSADLQAAAPVGCSGRSVRWCRSARCSPAALPAWHALAPVLHQESERCLLGQACTALVLLPWPTLWAARGLMRVVCMQELKYVLKIILLDLNVRTRNPDPQTPGSVLVWAARGGQPPQQGTGRPSAGHLSVLCMCWSHGLWLGLGAAACAGVLGRQGMLTARGPAQVHSRQPCPVQQQTPTLTVLQGACLAVRALALAVDGADADGAAGEAGSGHHSDRLPQGVRPPDRALDSNI